MPSSGWDGCRDLCVLPEALKKERWHIKTQEGWEPPAEGWNFKLGEAAWSLAFSLKQMSVSGVCSRDGVLYGSGGACMKVGRLSLRLLALEEENASLSAHCSSPVHQLLLWPLLDTTFPTRAQALAVYNGSLDSSSAGHTLVSFCTSRSAG